ncbi:MAG: CotH kinase family protein [Bacteroidota bacterium]
MKKFSLLLVSFIIQGSVFGQTYSGTGGSIIQVVDTSRFNINVNGLTPANIDNNFGLVSVTINITHTADRDIDCYIASPDGSRIELTTDNGSFGDNYTNTVFRYDASTPITSGNPPYSGSYIPEGDIWRMNNGQNGNGTWQLRVIDDTQNTSTGSVVSWSLTFGTNPPHPFLFMESNLPILIINTSGQTIVDSPKIICDMGIIDNGYGNRNHITDALNGYNGKIGIEIRGSSSQGFPKKSYGFETRDSINTAIKKDVSLLGMPAEHDWVLSANYTDKSFLHNFLTYQLQNEFGHWAPHCKFVDVVLNGQYIGIYVFMESIKRDNNRVNINHLHNYENTYPDISGGYIVKVDKTTGAGGAGWTSPYPPANHPNGQTIYFQYDEPSSDSITPQQKSYIQAYVDSFESSLNGPNFMDSTLGYAQYIGNGSFVDFLISNEVSKNVDGYRLSSYLYKDQEKTLKAGPIWDFDIAYGNANYCGGDDTLNWAYQFPCTGDGFQIPFWWQRMVTDSNFTNELKCRWNSLRENTLSQQHLNNIIDSVANYLNESQAWNFSVWPILGVYVWPNVAPYPSTYAGEIANMKQWLGRRLQWLDANIPGNCNCNLNVTAQNASCSGNCNGQAIAAGTSNYPVTYSWDNGGEADTLTSLCVGIYVVTMEDAVGCIQTDTVVVNSPASFTATTSAIQSNCGQCNGTAIALVTGGVGPFTFLWNNGQTNDTIINLCPGNYSVTITDQAGCSVLRSAFIAGNGSVTTNPSSTNLLCNGICNGDASISVTAGIPPFTYSWSPGGNTTSTVNNLCAGAYIVTTTDSNGCVKRDTIQITQPTVLNAIANTFSGVSCNGDNNGTASVSASGGTPPYGYSWSPAGGNSSNASNLSAGTYIVSVTDNNLCVDTVVIHINEPAALTLFTSATAASCGASNGTATCAPSGGVSPYTYAWLPIGGSNSTATNLPAGSYSVTVTDSNNCVQTTFVSVNNSGAPVMTLQSSNDVSCNGDSSGSAVVNTTGGTPPYSYSWSPLGGSGATANNLPAGNYVVTITDANSCISTLNISIQEPSAITTNLQVGNITCFGSCDGSASMNVSGGAGGFVYLWSNSATTDSVNGLCAGNYSIQVTDANLCVSNQNFNITQPASSLVVTVSHTNASCAGCPDGWASAIVNGGNSPYSYLWNTIPPQTTSLITGLLQGTYVVCVTDVNNCTQCDSVQILDASVGINEITKQSSPVYVYPNPLSNSASFIFSLSKKQKVLLQVFDARGKLVKELINELRIGGDHIFKMNATEMSEGIYHYHFQTEERVQDGSILIQR